MIYIPAESLVLNHIFWSDLTLITITTSTNYILSAAAAAKYRRFIHHWFLDLYQLPFFFISRPTDCMSHCRNWVITMLPLIPYLLEVSGAQIPQTSNRKWSIHSTKNQCFWDRRKFPSPEILRACTNLSVTGQISYSWQIKVRDRVPTFAHWQRKK